MTNTNLLKGAVKSKGYTLAQVATLIGISSTSFKYKINNVREFKASEISALIRVLDITDISKYFFCE